MGPQPSPSRDRGYLQALVVVAMAAVVAPRGAEAQTGPRILHDGLNCVLAGEHLILEALVEPTLELTTVKAYFRANLYTQFYYIEMEPVGEVYQGVLPKPSPEITGIHYYVEAVDSSFNSVRTAEFTPQVVTNETNCRERNPSPAAYLDGTGAIEVGTTGPGPGFPSGFLSEGIAGVIPTIGRTTGGGSGLLIGGAAAAGGAVGVGLLVTGSSETTSTPTTTVPGGSTTIPATTSVGATTSTVVSNLMACFNTSPAPPRIGVGGTVRFDASCTTPDRDQIQTYTWEFNDGRSGREGRVINRTYNTPGVFGTVLTVTALDGSVDIAEVDVVVEQNIAPPGGGGGSGRIVRISKGGPASATVGTQFAYTIDVTNTGGTTATGITVTDTIPANLTLGPVTFSPAVDSCSGGATVTCSIAALAPGVTGTITIRVTPTVGGSYVNTANLSVSSPSESASNRHRLNAALRSPTDAPTRITARLTSTLELPPGDGATQAQLTFNQSSSAMTDNSGPSTHEVQGRRGDNVIEGSLSQLPASEGVWRFDFRGTTGFVAGSFAVESGQILSRQSHELVFRVAPGARRIRFRFQLE